MVGSTLCRPASKKIGLMIPAKRESLLIEVGMYIIMRDKSIVAGIIMHYDECHTLQHTIYIYIARQYQPLHVLHQRRANCCTNSQKPLNMHRLTSAPNRASVIFSQAANSDLSESDAIHTYSRDLPSASTGGSGKPSVSSMCPVSSGCQ